jgi:hypothetical protein
MDILKEIAMKKTILAGLILDCINKWGMAGVYK